MEILPALGLLLLLPLCWGQVCALFGLGPEPARWSLKALVWAVAFLADNRAVVVGCGDGVLRVCAPRSGSVPATVTWMA